MTSTDTPRPPPTWVKRLLPLVLIAGAVVVWWAPGGAPRNAPSQPCSAISADAFAAALARGAVRGDARVAADGAVNVQFGPSVTSCSGSGALRVCRRTSDLVVEVRAEAAAPTHVLVPAGSDYRFVPARQGHVCEILVR